MKYSEKNKPLVCMQTTSACYKGTRKMSVKGVLWHSTGANNPNIKRYVQPSDNAVDREEMLEIIGVNTNKNDWNHTDRRAGMNCFIGKIADGSVTTVQTMPWDYRPWGCGSGPKGTCNDGWIQFEICEDGLNDKNYFDKVYKEACEITAYLCDMFDLDPKGTVEHEGIEVPVILCHADSHKLGLGSNHGDVNHWFPKFGKSMETAREDVAKLLEENKPKPQTELYRVRKSWEDSKSQIGAYSVLENAITACDAAGDGYFVFDSKGKAIYPEEKKVEIAVPALEIGDTVKLVPNAKYSSGKSIPAWVFKGILYIRDIRDNGDYVVSTVPIGPVTGVVKPEAVVAQIQPAAIPTYVVKITANSLNVRAGAGTRYQIKTTVHKNEAYTIVDEKDGWGKLKSGIGWISLKYTQRVK